MVPTSQTWAMPVISETAASSEVALDVAVEAESEADAEVDALLPQAARENAMLPAIASARNFFMVLISLFN